MDVRVTASHLRHKLHELIVPGGLREVRSLGSGQELSSFLLGSTSRKQKDWKKGEDRENALPAEDGAWS